ncbi:hypothetical protein GQ54DRAFT_339308 [Martensiomyces pterosporus]|nr:hypothetical protein GQ54DRAFT_339308 [Martensiomyces pterosporus]
MKRLLRGSKGDKKHDEGQTSPGSSKKTWAGASGVSALQQSRMRSGSHPQIRHLAMEGRTGPVTKATMEEIRRESGSPGSNFRINSLNTSSPDLKDPLAELQNTPDKFSKFSPPPSDNRNLKPPLLSGAATASAALEVAPWMADEAGRTALATPQSAPLPSQKEHAASVVSRAQPTELAPLSHPFVLAANAPASDDDGTASPIPSNNSPRVDYPPRTTSTVMMAPVPPRIDTSSKSIQRTQNQSARIMGAADKSAPASGSVFTNDSEASAPAGAGFLGEEFGFDPPVVASAPPVQPQSSPPLQPADSNKRMISDKIKNLATRFSNTNLGESPEQPPTPPVMTRRPSNSPSVSERVSLFAQQQPSDPRFSDIFGKFGEASNKPGVHSRSSSVAESTSRNSNYPSFPGFGSDSSALGHGKRRPLSTYQGIDLGGRMSGDAHSIPGEDTADGLGGTPSQRNSVGASTRDISNFAHHAPYLNTRASSSYASDLNLEDNEEGRYASSHRPVIKSKVNFDHQSTMAAGVQLNFNRSASSFNTQATSNGDSGVYRGVRTDGPTRRRGSIRTAFSATGLPAGAHEEGLLIVTDPVDTTNAHRPSVDGGALEIQTSIGRTSSGPTSPSGTRSSRTGSFRKAGSVIPGGRPGSTVSLADIQRSISASNSGQDPDVGGHYGSQSQSQSQTPTPHTATAPVSHPESRHSSALELQHTDASMLQGQDIDLDSEDILLNTLSRDLDTNAPGSLDEALSKAVAVERVATASSTGEGSDADLDAQATSEASVAASLITPVLREADTSKILPVSEYERYTREVPSLKSRLQSARTRLSLEIRMRDTAKNLAELNSKSSGRSKGKHQAQVDDYNTANAKVQQVEMEITDLSTKLRLMETSLRDHQVAVLASAVKTMLGEAAYVKDSMRKYSTFMQTRVHNLEREEADARASFVAEKGRIVADNANARLGLEAQIRRLQNMNHEAQARRISKEADDSDPESPLTRHSANRAVERLNGELLVLREQKVAAETQAKSLEAKLDEALLRAQEAQHALSEIRSQASDMAEVSRSRLEAARNEADSSMQCVEAFAAGLRETLGPLRMLKGVHDSAEKMRALNEDEVAPASTPPTTPTLKVALTLPKDALSVDTLESILLDAQSDSVNGDGAAAATADNCKLGAASASSAMALIASTISGCSGLYSEAVKVYEAHSQLQKDLSTEKRLREAQGLAIAQQREKLNKASYLADSADQRVQEATNTLATKHTEAQAAWEGERQRLIDNIERLTMDIKDLKATSAAEAVASRKANTGDAASSELRSVPSLAPTSSAAAGLAGAASSAAVGSIEYLHASNHESESSQQARIQSLEARVASLDKDIDLAKQQLSDKLAENGRLQLQISELALLRERTSQMEATIGQLKATEAVLRSQLAEQEPLKEMSTSLRRNLSTAQGKVLSQDDAPLSGKPALGDYMQRLKDANSVLAGAPSAKHSAAASRNAADTASVFSSVSTPGIRGHARQLSLPSVPQTRTGNDRAAVGLASLASPSVRSATAARSDKPSRLTDAQTMTDSSTKDQIASDDIGHMHLVYSEKLMCKEDALRNREDELEAIRALVAEVEGNLQSILPSAATDPHSSSAARSLTSTSPLAGSSAPWVSSTTPSKASLRNRSASFFQGLRSNYLGLSGSPDLQPRPSLPEPQPPAPQAGLYGGLTRVSSSQSLNQPLASPSPTFGRSPRVQATAPVASSPNGTSPKAAKGAGADGVPSIVHNLIPLTQMASTEVRRLKSLVCDLEDQSRETRMELLETQEKLTNLQSYCSQRAKKEDSVQQDITHVLGQIARLRTKITQLEKEKAACEDEARALWRRCHEAENQAAEQVLQLIVQRVGKSDWAQKLLPDGMKRSATEPANRSSMEANEKRGEGAAATGGEAKPRAVPSKFASLSAISMSHPQANEIRAEFNELLHQVISRRDEDLERIQALADALRVDARQAAQANEFKAWNTATRGVQTM